jgi:hypothetical protein
MPLTPELKQFISKLSPAMPGDPDALKAAGRALGIDWPAEYEAVMSERDGGKSEIGGWPVDLWPASTLVHANTGGTRAPIRAGVVWVGWDGLGELYGFERATGKVVLRTADGEVEVYRDSLTEWIRRPPDFSDSRHEAVHKLDRAEDRLGRLPGTHEAG